MSVATVEIIHVGPEALDPQALAAEVRADTSGAIATFVGVVRNHHQGRRVHHLVYEAYPPMAEAELRRIAAEMRERWTCLSGIALAHRTGRLEIGETSVAVVVASAHRREALDACAFGIERIKQSVPIWKKEFSEEGEEWVIGDSSPHGPPGRE